MLVRIISLSAQEWRMFKCLWFWPPLLSWPAFGTLAIAICNIDFADRVRDSVLFCDLLERSFL